MRRNQHRVLPLDDEQLEDLSRRLSSAAPAADLPEQHAERWQRVRDGSELQLEQRLRRHQLRLLQRRRLVGEA
jgi:hypothetical protein